MRKSRSQFQASLFFSSSQVHAVLSKYVERQATQRAIDRRASTIGNHFIRESKLMNSNNNREAAAAAERQRILNNGGGSELPSPRINGRGSATTREDQENCESLSSLVWRSVCTRLILESTDFLFFFRFFYARFGPFQQQPHLREPQSHDAGHRTRIDGGGGGECKPASRSTAAKWRRRRTHKLRFCLKSRNFM